MSGHPTAKWTEQDSLLAVALTVFEAQLCSGCGHPIAETMGEENDGMWESEEFRCHACNANAENAERLSKKGSTHLRRMSVRSFPGRPECEANMAQAERSVSVVLKADIRDYTSKMDAASKATKDFAAQTGKVSGSAATSTKNLGTSAKSASGDLDKAAKSAKGFGTAAGKASHRRG